MPFRTSRLMAREVGQASWVNNQTNSSTSTIIASNDQVEWAVAKSENSRHLTAYIRETAGKVVSFVLDTLHSLWLAVRFIFAKIGLPLDV